MLLQVGRSLYWNIDKIEPLGGGLTLAHGGFLSGVLGWQPYLNVDGKTSMLIDMIFYHFNYKQYFYEAFNNF